MIPFSREVSTTDDDTDGWWQSNNDKIRHKARKRMQGEDRGGRGQRRERRGEEGRGGEGREDRNENFVCGDWSWGAVAFWNKRKDWSEKTHTTNTPINRIKGREQHGETRANSPKTAVEGWLETQQMAMSMSMRDGLCQTVVGKQCKNQPKTWQIDGENLCKIRW